MRHRIAESAAMTTFTNQDLLEGLKRHFGFDEFLPGQFEAISQVMSGGHAVVLAPTGNGKSLNYQLPAVMKEGVALVISPLIALMKDQVEALRRHGINADFFNSQLDYWEKEQVQRRLRAGMTKILYVAPERFASDSGFDLSGLPVSLIAIDEAHCISEWGHDFRPEYRNLKSLCEMFPSVPVIALTATATTRTLSDITEQLGLAPSDVKVVRTSLDRKNLTYRVINKRSEAENLSLLANLLREKGDESAIVYCFSRRETEKVSSALKHLGLNVDHYHAGLEEFERTRRQEMFMSGDVKIVVATIAFGMGIDKPDIRTVVHWDMPKSIEGYYQETGRAGRDGEPADCVLMFENAAYARLRSFAERVADDETRLRSYESLSAIYSVCTTGRCRRRLVLAHFGEEIRAGANCGRCDNCLTEKTEVDATEISHQIMSAVIRTGSRFGARYIIEVLKGSKNQRVLSNRHEALKVHGAARAYSIGELQGIIGKLQDEGLLRTIGAEFPLLDVTREGWAVLRNRSKVTLFDVKIRSGGSEDTNSKRLPRKGDELLDPALTELFETLRGLRLEIAREEGVPAFVVFSDSTLREITASLPRSEEKMLAVKGVGPQKWSRYGQRFVDAIDEWIATRRKSR